MKPAFPYYGGKTVLAQVITPYFPTTAKTYVEAFCGSAAVFFAAPRGRWAKVEILNDLNSNVVTFFRVMRDHPEDLIEKAQLMPYSREELYRAIDVINDGGEEKDETTRALAFFVACAQSFAAKRTSWSLPSMLHRTPRVKTWKRRTSPEFLWQVAQRLRAAHIENYPAEEVIKLYDGPETFLYLDPPYLAVNDPYGKNAAYSGFDMKEPEHEAFIDLVASCQSMIAISGYDHPLYARLTEAGWSKVVIPWRATAATGTYTEDENTESRKDREEILWLNPALIAAQPEDYRQSSLFGD